MIDEDKLLDEIMDSVDISIDTKTNIVDMDFCRLMIKDVINFALFTTDNKVLQKLRSIKLCMMAHPDNTKGSEFEDRIDDLEELEQALKL